MSRAAEKAFEAQFAKHLEDCARDLVVGATVYRAEWDRVEQGSVVRVSRCRIRQQGEPIEDAAGPEPYYVAQFKNDWVGQTYQWRWFFDINAARHELVRKVRERADELRRKSAECEVLIAETERAIASPAADEVTDRAARRWSKRLPDASLVAAASAGSDGVWMCAGDGHSETRHFRASRVESVRYADVDGREVSAEWLSRFAIDGGFRFTDAAAEPFVIGGAAPRARGGAGP